MSAPLSYAYNIIQTAAVPASKACSALATIMAQQQQWPQAGLEIATPQEYYFITSTTDQI